MYLTTSLWHYFVAQIICVCRTMQLKICMLQTKNKSSKKGTRKPGGKCLMVQHKIALLCVLVSSHLYLTQLMAKTIENVMYFVPCFKKIFYLMILKYKKILILLHTKITVCHV